MDPERAARPLLLRSSRLSSWGRRGGGTLRFFCCDFKGEFSYPSVPVSFSFVAGVSRGMTSRELRRSKPLRLNSAERVFFGPLDMARCVDSASLMSTSLPDLVSWCVRAFVNRDEFFSLRVCGGGDDGAELRSDEKASSLLCNEDDLILWTVDLRAVGLDSRPPSRRTRFGDSRPLLTRMPSTSFLDRFFPSTPFLDTSLPSAAEAVDMDLCNFRFAGDSTTVSASEPVPVSPLACRSSAERLRDRPLLDAGARVLETARRMGVKDVSLPFSVACPARVTEGERLEPSAGCVLFEMGAR